MCIYIQKRSILSIYRSIYGGWGVLEGLGKKPSSSNTAYVSIRQHTTAYVSIRQHTDTHTHIRGVGGTRGAGKSKAAAAAVQERGTAYPCCLGVWVYWGASFQFTCFLYWYSVYLLPRNLSLLMCLFSVYLLSLLVRWQKTCVTSTKKYKYWRLRRVWRSTSAMRSTQFTAQFTCFTGTKVQILTLQLVAQHQRHFALLVQ